MDKKQMLMIGFAIFTVVLFILENFSFGFLTTGVNPLRLSGGDAQAPVIQTENGIAEFDATLKYYESYLVSKDKLEQEMITKIKENNRVLSITNSQQGYIIEVKTKDDVLEVYNYLKTLNISAKGVANFGAPQLIEVKLADGRVIETNGNEGIALRLDIEPTIKEGSRIRMKMVTIAQGEVISQYGQPQLVSSLVTINGAAIITEFVGSNSNYFVPWEQRNDINVSALSMQYTDVTYARKDAIIFNQTLTVEQIKEKKKLQYVTFISENSAEINSSFEDKEAIKKDFGLNVTFLDSILTISTNRSMDLTYKSETKYRYKLEVNNTGSYSLQDRNIELVMDKIYEVGTEIPVTFDLEVVAGNVKNITNVKLNQTS